jgi:hypothetical protein
LTLQEVLDYGKTEIKEHDMHGLLSCPYLGQGLNAEHQKAKREWEQEPSL